MKKGILYLVKNSLKKFFFEADEYFVVVLSVSPKIKKKYGLDFMRFAFTKRELMVPFNRAIKNPEDFGSDVIKDSIKLKRVPDDVVEAIINGGIE